ncbi:laccase [Hygrophoropsis aurantiaca]|uniref:Laccase n=1 Tax=Hygrophoropsis aurantiaca TaxID=72124 RepID=A0ACB8AAZ9_9AGAM|nr:laccase [Hygrophoropsis aurantiaca]
MLLSIILAFTLLSTSRAASIVSRSSSKPLIQTNVIGPVTNLTISNKVIAPDGFQRSTTLAGGTFPGPLIKAHRGDHFRINVVNELTDKSMFKTTTIHWHGIVQNGTNYADGVAFVTQCPIAPNDSYLHEFDVTNQAGTYWYHSHYSTQTCDGLRGPLVIYDHQDPLAHMYDIDDETTIITLADWYHIIAPALNNIIGVNANSTLINGKGRYLGGPATELSVINVQHGKRYRMRLLSMTCDPYFTFSIDGHNMTIIEADGELTHPLLVDSLQILAGQRYSFVFTANQHVGNYWIRSLPNTANSTFEGGANMAILRYQGAPEVDPTTNQTKSVMPLVEKDLHALISPGAPGIPVPGAADINLHMVVQNIGGTYWVNNVTYKPPPVPVLLQILSGAQAATDLMPNGSVVVLEPNKVVELTMEVAGFGGPHPIHLHGHSFDVVQSAGPNSTFNYLNPVRRDVVSTGIQGQGMTIRFVTDNSGPWFLHCHIDWHLEAGFAVVMAENPAGVAPHIGQPPPAWDDLCPIFNSLTPDQLGAPVGGFGPTR